MSQDIISKINEVVAKYFEDNKSVDWVAAKKVMPELIEAGVFSKDIKKGLPLRKLLRALDENKNLGQVPLVHAERTGKDIYWYFVREGATFQTYEGEAPISKKERGILNTEGSDKFYVLNLCDKLLKQTASRQHRFKFLLGDLHRDGVTRTPIPVDAFYQGSSLVLDFFERQINLNEEDNLNKKTISGVSRAEQRKLYNQRKKDVLAEKGIKFIEFDYSAFECDKDQKLLRKKINDSKVLKGILKDFIV